MHQKITMYILTVGLTIITHMVAVPFNVRYIGPDGTGVDIRLDTDMSQISRQMSIRSTIASLYNTNPLCVQLSHTYSEPSSSMIGTVGRFTIDAPVLQLNECETYVYGNQLTDAKKLVYHIIGCRLPDTYLRLLFKFPRAFQEDKIVYVNQFMDTVRSWDLFKLAGGSVGVGITPNEGLNGIPIPLSIFPQVLNEVLSRPTIPIDMKEFSELLSAYGLPATIKNIDEYFHNLETEFP